MLSKNNILVNDTCVLFDLMDLGLLEDFFQLEFEFYTTPQVVEEITEPEQYIKIRKLIEIKALKIDSFGSLDSIQTIFENYSALSYTDCSVLELALRIEGILISSDKSLRNISRSNKLVVKGLLWVVTEMLEQGIISLDLAIEKLKLYPIINIRAPKKEIKTLLDKLSKDNNNK